MKSTKKLKNIIFILIFFILILFIFNYINYNNYNTLSNSYFNLENNYNILEENYFLLNNTYSDLNKDYFALKYNNKELENSIYNLNENIIELESIIDSKEKIISNQKQEILDNKNIIEDLNEFREQIEISMSWFSYNSNLNAIKSTGIIDQNKRLKKHLDSCIDCNNNSCYIKTACIDFINKKKLNLVYEKDLLSIGKEDKLIDIWSFFNSKKGDCEDFALLYAAELRYLIKEVENKEKKPIIESFIHTGVCTNYEGGRCLGYNVYGNWYYTDGLKEFIPKDYIYPSIVCGYFNLDLQDNSAHCAILISNKEINDKNDLISISGYIIESQSGELLGTLNVDENNSYKLIDSNTNELNIIFQIITKNDIYFNNSIYKNISVRESKWLSYYYFLQKINNI
jgi:hypothetical protein